MIALTVNGITVSAQMVGTVLWKPQTQCARWSFNAAKNFRPTLEIDHAIIHIYRGRLKKVDANLWRDHEAFAKTRHGYAAWAGTLDLPGDRVTCPSAQND
nr:hypothetical protein CFP56_28590 [Quercus suber]